MCSLALTPTCFIAPSTSCQLIPTVSTPTTPLSFTTEQQNRVSSDDDCNEAAIVVPIVLVLIASTVAICTVMFIVIRWKKTTHEYDLSTSKKDEIICVVKNDLYELGRYAQL